MHPIVILIISIATIHQYHLFKDQYKENTVKVAKEFPRPIIILSMVLFAALSMLPFFTWILTWVGYLAAAIAQSVAHPDSDEFMLDGLSCFIFFQLPFFMVLVMYSMVTAQLVTLIR